MLRLSVYLIVGLLTVCTPRLVAAGELTLAWDPPTDGVTTSYVLSIGTSPKTYTREIEVGHVTEFKVTDLTPGATYYFVVRAKSGYGTLSDPSTELRARVPAAPPPQRPPVDLNNDGKRDLLFQSVNGDLYAWFMHGTSIAGETQLSPARIDPQWLVVSVRDFTGDGRPDLLMQHQQTRAVRLFEMHGNSRVREQDIVAPSNSPWIVVAAEDFNADGHADIVWQNFATGQIFVWFMKPSQTSVGFAGADGTFLGEYVRDEQGDLMTLGPTTRRVVAAADMNRDGRQDLIWQDDDSTNVGVWYLNGVMRTGEAAITPATKSASWRVRVAGDYNGDGWPDLIWHNDVNGDLYAWFMNGATMVTGAYLNPPRLGLAWRIVGP